MIGKVYKGMEAIRDNGDIKLTLGFGNNMKHDVIAIPGIQFIIGDSKGNDLLCGRIDTSPDNGDNICIDHRHLCSLHNMNTIVSKSEVELQEYSFLPIKSTFHDVSFGGCERIVYIGTPVKILHAVLLGFCDFIAESIDLIFRKNGLDALSYIVSGICDDTRRQSERDLSDLGPFKHGLMSVKYLKTKDRFGRVYCLCLSLSNSYLIESLCTKKRKKKSNELIASSLSKEYLKGFYGVIQETLLFHLWLKKDKYLKSDFEINTADVDSRAMKRIKQYLQNFKVQIIRGGNELKTPKFHQMLHIVDYIQRHGCPMTYDDSRGENFRKLKIKDNTKLTNRQKDTLNFDIARRISEEGIADHVSIVYHDNSGDWPSMFCNETDIMASDNRVQLMTNNNGNSLVRHNVAKPRYMLSVEIENIENDNVAEIISMHVDWGGQSKTPLPNFPNDLLKIVCKRLYIGSSHLGGKVSHDSVVKGYTEIKSNGTLIRSHPCYANKGSWYDSAYFDWEECDTPIVA